MTETNVTITPPQMTKAAIAAAGAEYVKTLLDSDDDDPFTTYKRLRALRGVINRALVDYAIAIIDAGDAVLLTAYDIEYD